MDRETWNAVAFAMDVLFKATLLIGFAGGVRLLLRRASASLRQAVGVLALGGVLLLPALAPVLPDWKVPVIPAVIEAREDRAEHAGGRIERTALVIEDTGISGESESTAARPAESGASSVPRANRERPADFGYGVLARPDAAPVASRTAAIPLPSAGALALGVLLLWGAGAAMLLLRLATGVLRVARDARAAEPALDERWIELRRELSERLSLRRPVRFLFSDRVPVAVTAGFRRPVLLMPQAARRWTPELRRVVVLHELAHVRRGDWLALILAETAAAVYWFHPLVWVAVRQLRRDSEQAADDLVLKSGTKPSVYAGHLLGIIRSLRSPAPPPLPVMGVARPSQFEARLKAILDPAASRKEPSTGQLRVAATFAAAAVLTLGALQPWKNAEAAPVPQSASWETNAEAMTASEGDSETARSCGKGKPKKNDESDAVPAKLAEAPDEGDTDYAEVTAERETAASESELAHGEAPSEGEGFAFPAIMPVPAETKVSGFVQASRRQPRDGDGWYSRGMHHHNDGEYDEAIAAFQKAIGLGHREDAASYNIACGYALKGDADRAFEWLDRAMDEGFDVSEYIGKDDDLDGLKPDPRFAQYRQKARKAKGVAHKRAAERKLARFERLAQSEPKNGGAWYKLGYELYQIEEHDRAASAFRQAAELGYREPTSLYNTACMLSLKGDRRGALDFLEKAILAGFGSPEKIREDDDLDNIRSEARYGELVKLARDLDLPDLPQWNWHHNFTGTSKKRVREEWREAAGEIETYARQHPRIGLAWFNLGFARIQAGQPEDAAPAFQKALELGHRRPTTMYNLACSYALMDRKDQAFEWLFKAIDAGFDGKGMIRQDEDLNNLRGDPRYRQAVKLADARHPDDHDDGD